MIKSCDIELCYFNSIWHEHQWFVLYEFKVHALGLFQETDKTILKEIFSTRMLSEKLYHKEFDDKKFKLEGLKDRSGRPYKFRNISLTDFQYLQNNSEFDQWLRKFRIDGWEEDRKDTQILIDQAEHELWHRMNPQNGIWYLSKDHFSEASNKLAELHWFYIHFETFIEIDKENKLIRTFDFGYD